MSPDTAPLAGKKETLVPALATDAEGTTPLFEAPYALTVTAVSYVPAADITGAATNNRKVALVNKGSDGNGTTEVAALTYDNAINSTDFNETALTLSATAANLSVAAGDVLAWASTAPGTGLADPGGTAIVEWTRA